MLRYLLVFVMFVHGFIHLIGFAKAFGQIQQITSDISPIKGFIWLIVSLLFVLASILFLLKNGSWLWVAIVACTMSQILIVTLWNEAKFGTIANLLILTAAIVTLAGKETKYIFGD